MDGEQLVSLRLAHPFRPFTLVMADGQRLPVVRSSHVAISPDRQGIVYPKPSGGFDILRVADIVAAEVDASPATAGRSKRR